MARSRSTRRQRERITMVQRNGLRLQKLVNALLDFSRVEAGRIQAVYQPTDLASLTHDLVSSFRSACEKAGLTLTIDTPPLPEPVFVDHEMWEKIVLNLVSNAFKFTLEGGIKITMSARGRACRVARQRYRHGHSRVRGATDLRPLPSRRGRARAHP